MGSGPGLFTRSDFPVDYNFFLILYFVLIQLYFVALRLKCCLFLTFYIEIPKTLFVQGPK